MSEPRIITEPEFEQILADLYRDPTTQPKVFKLRNERINAVFAGNKAEADRCMNELVALAMTKLRPVGQIRPNSSDTDSSVLSM